MTCARCEELEERVAWLESELGIQRDATDYARLRIAMKRASPAGAGGWSRRSGVLLVMALLQANGRVMSRLQLLEAIPPADRGDDDRSPKIIDVWVCCARRAFGADLIDTVMGRGYRLSEVGSERIRAILNPAGTQAASMGVAA